MNADGGVAVADPVDTGGTAGAEAAPADASQAGAAGQNASAAAAGMNSEAAVPPIDSTSVSVLGGAGVGAAAPTPQASSAPAVAGATAVMPPPPSAADAGTGASAPVMPAMPATPEPEPDPEPVCTPETEQCHNLDNDCDGKVDEQIEPRPCGMDVGECKPGTISCRAGQWDDEATRCAGAVESSAERCDDRDNDCDGETDEDVLNECGGCEALANPPGRTCSAGEFACEASGRYQCRGQNATACDAEPRRGSADNQCDNQDNDCDGQIDEDGDNGCRGPCSARLVNKPEDRCTVQAKSSGPSGCDRVGAWTCSGTSNVRCEAPIDAPTVGECGCTYGCNNAETGETRVVVSQTLPDLGPEWLCVKADPNCN